MADGWLLFSPLQDIDAYTYVSCQWYNDITIHHCFLKAFSCVSFNKRCHFIRTLHTAFIDQYPVIHEHVNINASILDLQYQYANWTVVYCDVLWCIVMHHNIVPSLVCILLLKDYSIKFPNKLALLLHAYV